MENSSNHDFLGHLKNAMQDMTWRQRATYLWQRATTFKDSIPSQKTVSMATSVDPAENNQTDPDDDDDDAIDNPQDVIVIGTQDGDSFETVGYLLPNDKKKQKTIINKIKYEHNYAAREHILTQDFHLPEWPFIDKAGKIHPSSQQRKNHNNYFALLKMNDVGAVWMMSPTLKAPSIFSAPKPVQQNTPQSAKARALEALFLDNRFIDPAALTPLETPGFTVCTAYKIS